MTTRLAAYLFTKLGGFEAQFIPFRGGAEVASGLLTGSVDFTVDGVAANLALVQSGKLRTLGKLNFSSLPALPDVEPLAVSADLPALGKISTWAGLVAPAATPLVLRQKIYRAVVEAYKDPAVLGRLKRPASTGPQARLKNSFNFIEAKSTDGPRYSKKAESSSNEIITLLEATDEPWCTNGERMRLIGGVVLAGAIAVVVVGVTNAQELPNCSVKIVVSGPPGGTPDLIARLGAEKISAGIGRPVVVENRAGGLGAITSIDAVKAAEPNGCTLLLRMRRCFRSCLRSTRSRRSMPRTISSRFRSSPGLPTYWSSMQSFRQRIGRK